MLFSNIITTLETLESRPVMDNNTDDIVDDSVVYENNRSMVNTDQEIVSGHNALQAINELVEYVKEHGEQGELSEFQNNVIHVTYESIMTNLGFDMTQSTMESFNGISRSDILQTLESSASKVNMGLGDLLRRSREDLSKGFEDLTRVSFILRRSIKEAKAKVELIKSQTPRKQVMSEFAGTLTAGPDLLKNPTAVKDSVEKMYITAIGLLKLSEIAADKLSNLNFNYGDLNDKTTFEMVNFERVGVPKVSSGAAGKYNNCFGYLTNARSYIRGEAKTVGAWRHPGYGIQGEVSNGNKAESIQVGSPDFLKDVLDKADAILRILDKVDSRWSRIKVGLSRFIDDDIIGPLTVIPSLVSDKAKAARDNAYMRTAMVNFIMGILIRMPMECYKIAKAFTNYTESSLKYYDVSK